MERVERVVVHLEEAWRLAAARGDTARLRVALILFDSACELLLYRECQYLLLWQRHPRRLLEYIRRCEEQGVALTQYELQRREELEREVLSKSREKKVQREFDAKVDLLVEQQVIEVDVAIALKRLHKYRNETYHRDQVRPATLDSAVRIYAYLSCLLLRDLPPHVVEWTRSDEPLPEALRSYVGEGPPPRSFDIQRVVAEAMLARWDVQCDLSQLLSGHLLDRLNEIEEHLQFAAAYRRDLPGSTERLSAWDVLVLLQVKDPRIAVFGTVEELRRLDVAVTKTTFDSWRVHCERLASEPDNIRAFNIFADIETQFEPIEEEVRDLVQALDEQIDAAVDEARGG